MRRGRYWNCRRPGRLDTGWDRMERVKSPSDMSMIMGLDTAEAPLAEYSRVSGGSWRLGGSDERVQ